MQRGGVTHDDDWRFVHYDGTLSNGARAITGLGKVYAAAFAPGCALLALVRDARGDEVELVDGLTGAHVVKATL